jgi:glycosyltransferase involved in cell wall biosynthesis
MKILIQSFNYHPHELGGSERSARDLARGLAGRGHDVGVLLSDASKPYPPEVDGLAVHPVDGLKLGLSPLWEGRNFRQRMLWNLRSEIDPVLLGRLTRFLRREKPDVVLINNPAGHGSALMLAARRAGVPILPVIRDYGWFCAFGVMTRDGRNCTELCGACSRFSTLRRRLMRGQPVIAISGFVADLVGRVAPEARVEVIHNSVPDAVVDTPKANAVTEGPGLRFGYLGRLHPTKGVVELLEGWQAARPWEQGHRLRLAGDNQGLTLPENAAEIGIDILGRQEPIAFLDTLDALFVPSMWNEPFGRSVIEGLARGLYVIGSPNGAGPRLIPEGAGEVLPAITGDAVAEVLGRLVADPAPILAMRGKDRAGLVAEFRQQPMLDRYEDALRRAASG